MRRCSHGTGAAHVLLNLMSYIGIKYSTYAYLCHVIQWHKQKNSKHSVHLNTRIMMSSNQLVTGLSLLSSPQGHTVTMPDPLPPLSSWPTFVTCTAEVPSLDPKSSVGPLGRRRRRPRRWHPKSWKARGTPPRFRGGMVGAFHVGLLDGNKWH